jgi:hypothetical protein
MGTLLGLGVVLVYHEHRCRVSGKRASMPEQRDLIGSVFMNCRNTTCSLNFPD